MKKTRRIAAMIAALTLAACSVAPMMMTANAADVNVKVQADGNVANETTNQTPDADKAEHIYTAYQIFKGEKGTNVGEFNITGLGANADNLLTNSAFLAFRAADGKESVGEALAKLPVTATNDQKAIAAAQAISGITSGGKKADELAAILAVAASGTGTPITTAGVDLSEGYYVVTDTYTKGTTGSNDAISKFILRVNSAENSDGITIVPKKSYPSVIKKVQENTKSVSDYATDDAFKNSVNTADKWNDVADYNIGDDVPFQLYGTMPETLSDYDAYYYKFTDTLSNKFEQPKKVTVKAGNSTLVFDLDEEDGDTKGKYKLTSGADTLAAAEEKTVTTYSFATEAAQTKIYAALKDVEAYTGIPGAAAKAEYINANWETLIAEGGALNGLFSDKNAAITATEKTIPAVNADATTDGNCRVTWNDGKLVVSFENIKAYAGVTEDTIVTVNYSAELKADAIIGLDGQENKVDLTYSNNPNVEYNPKNDNEEDRPGDNNEDKTPEDKVVVFTYEIDITKIDGATKQKLEGAEFEIQNGAGTAIKLIDNGDGTYTVADADDDTLTPVTQVKSDEDGLFKIKGLDSGTYTLVEKVAPAGYEVPTGDAARFAVELTATTVNTQTWNGTAASDVLTGLTGTIGGVGMTAVEANAAINLGANGAVAGTIENNKGTTLPSAGGIGTVLFYTIGGVMVVGAGVVLVTKKRLGKEN